MKKLIIILALISLIFTLTNKEEDYVIIPKDSIRFRIIPNSNSLEDLTMKEKVKTSISSVISDIETSTDIKMRFRWLIIETRKYIISSEDLISEKISTLFKENNYDKSFTIKYGINYFPEKIYKGVKYESGNYESLLIKIGASSGDNYWCVLFPPLCMMDAKETNMDDIEYTSFIKETINKIFKKHN